MTNILLIDDNPEDREWIVDLLHNTGNFTITPCASGEEGLWYLEEHQSDCVLLDWHLPGQDGSAILATLKANMPSLPVIIITGQEIEAGTSKHVPKNQLTTEKLSNLVLGAMAQMQDKHLDTSSNRNINSILLVEDNEDDRMQIEQMILGVDGHFSVNSFAIGTEALAYFKDHGADCIILDYRLEVENGLDILTKLKQVSAFIPVIMLTGQGNEEIAATSIKAGASDYLVKQRLNTTYLQTAIGNAMNRAMLETKIADQEIQQQRFLSTLVHDLRAPLRNIRELGEMLIEESQDGDLEQIQSLLKTQSSIASRAADLIDTLEVYALLDGEVVFEKTSLTQAAKAAKENLAAVIHDCQAEVEIHDMPNIHGHAPQLTQLFQNLIGNGLKYNESTPPMISITCESNTVLIKDNGIGISTKYLKTIFTPLKRLWGNGKYKGTGLGLAICQKVVERHKGTIWCTSSEGDGSEFHIQFPQLTSE